MTFYGCVQSARLFTLAGSPNQCDSVLIAPFNPMCAMLIQDRFWWILMSCLTSELWYDVLQWWLPQGGHVLRLYNTLILMGLTVFSTKRCLCFKKLMSSLRGLYSSGCQTQFLEGRCPAEFSSNPAQHTNHVVFNWAWRTWLAGSGVFN